MNSKEGKAKGGSRGGRQGFEGLRGGRVREGRGEVGIVTVGVRSKGPLVVRRAGEGESCCLNGGPRACVRCIESPGHERNRWARISGNLMG